MVEDGGLVVVVVTLVVVATLVVVLLNVNTPAIHPRGGTNGHIPPCFFRADIPLRIRT
jgi:hypothetical protein